MAAKMREDMVCSFERVLKKGKVWKVEVKRTKMGRKKVKSVEEMVDPSACPSPFVAFEGCVARSGCGVLGRMCLATLGYRRCTTSYAHANTVATSGREGCGIRLHITGCVDIVPVVPGVMTVKQIDGPS
jgi:hypothetical protein